MEIDYVLKMCSRRSFNQFKNLLNLQVIKMLICVVVLFLLCWGPRFIMELLIKLQFSWLWTTEVYIARTYIFLLPMVHAILNPVVYFIMSQSFGALCAVESVNVERSIFRILACSLDLPQTLKRNRLADRNR